MCIFFNFCLLVVHFLLIIFSFSLRCTVWKRVKLLLGRREALLSCFVSVQGAGECVHTTCFSAGVWSHVSVYFVSSQMWFYFYFFNSFYLMIFFFCAGHVIKLFIVLYHALKHGDLGWMLCVSGLWCSNYSSSSFFLSLWGSQRGQNERTCSISCCSWMAQSECSAVKSLIS